MSHPPTWDGKVYRQVKFGDTSIKGKRRFKAVLLSGAVWVWVSSVHLFFMWTLEMLRDALEALRAGSRVGVRGYG